MSDLIGISIPNHIVEWTLLIVTYPFFSGIIAGGTVITVLVYLLGMKQLEPMERMGHFLGLALIFTAPLCPMFDLKQPFNSLFIPFYPNFTSPILLFFILWTILTFVMLAKTYYMFRRDFEVMSETGGIFAKIAGKLMLGAKNVNPEEDDSKVKVWASISIPVAMFFHAYVGFLMVSMVSMPLWGTPILLVMFLISALVSGVGAAILLYMMRQKIIGEPIDYSIMKIPLILMAVFAGIDLFLLFIEIVTEFYWNTEHWFQIAAVLAYNAIPFAIEVLGLAFILIYGLMSMNSITPRKIVLLSALSLISVYAARWMMVIPAQMIDKGGYGIVEPIIHWTGREGALEVVALFCWATFLFLVFISLAGWKSSFENDHTAEGVINDRE